MDTTLRVREDASTVNVLVRRGGHALGRATVTVQAHSRTAVAGFDFDATPITLSWADGDTSDRSASIPILDDRRREPNEAFTVRLTAPSADAAVAEAASVQARASSLPALRHSRQDWS